MKAGIHGGDIYRNDVKFDFSVNINPYGIPESVRQAMLEGICECNHYPDIECEDLRAALGIHTGAEAGNIICGNGASELFMAVAHAIKPKKGVILVPSFYGYERALNAVCCENIYYHTGKENNFMPDEKIFDVLTEDTDILFLANPNNPTGNITDRKFLVEIAEYCRQRNIFVVLDECFIEFVEENRRLSMMENIKKFENLVIVRAFTKIYAIPGIRLGYLVCGNDGITAKIKEQLPEWNVSVPAQRAGIAALKEKEYIRKSLQLITEEREFLSRGLEGMDIKVYPSETDFLLIETGIRLDKKLLEKGILIRDCGNFRGLEKGFYRIAVKKREENQLLLDRISELKKIIGS